jgi:hypothetical protein
LRNLWRKEGGGDSIHRIGRKKRKTSEGCSLTYVVFLDYITAARYGERNLDVKKVIRSATLFVTAECDGGFLFVFSRTRMWGRNLPK